MRPFLRKVEDVTVKWAAEIQFSKIDEMIPETDPKRESFGKFFFDCNEKHISTHDNAVTTWTYEKVQRRRMIEIFFEI